MIHKAIIFLNELKAMRLMAGEDESRFVLCGVRVELSKDRTLLIATDGRRLTVLKSAVTPAANAPELPPAVFTIPSDLIDGLRDEPVSDGCPECGYGGQPGGQRLDIAFDSDTRSITMNLGSVAVVGQTIDGEFPNFRNKPIPQTDPQSIESLCFNPEFIADYVKVGQLLRGNSYGSVKLQFSEIESKTDGSVTLIEVWLSELADRFYGVLMPMKWTDGTTERPTWL